MASNKTLLMLPGDGIGPEVMGEVRRVVDWMDRRRAVGFDVKEDLVGGASYDAHGTPLTDAALDAAMTADAVLLGAVGGPNDDVARQHRPEAGLLTLRKEMDLFANLRPAITFDALAGRLDPEARGGPGPGHPDRARTHRRRLFRRAARHADPGRRHRTLHRHPGLHHRRDRAGRRVAFELARERGNKVHSVEKANVMETGVFWRKTVTDLHARGGYGDIELEHMYADNCAMQLVRWPKQFDVIVTDNLFGDMLSDCAAMLTGSLGMLPSASLGAVDETGRRKALYEPVHGSAPDIAGQNAANPLAMVLSFAMALRYSFGLGDDADLIEQAAQNVLNRGIRTADLMSDGATQVSTTDMGAALVKELDRWRLEPPRSPSPAGERGVRGFPAPRGENPARTGPDEGRRGLASKETKMTDSPPSTGPPSPRPRTTARRRPPLGGRICSGCRRSRCRRPTAPPSTSPLCPAPPSSIIYPKTGGPTCRRPTAGT